MDVERRWSRLAERAMEAGCLPVIVTLEVGFRPEGELSNDERVEQQQRIAETGRALLDELAGTRLERVSSFLAVPQLTMTVGLDALALLRRSASVRAVVEDVPISPV